MTDLKPNTKIRVLINGEGVYCRVKDCCSSIVLKAIAEFNELRARPGHKRPCIGIMRRYDSTHPSGYVDIQIDVIK